MCVIAAKFFKDTGWVGVKNRDRNYKPEVVIKQSFRKGVERLFLYDKKTKYTEGINEYGISILSAAVAVKKDEKAGAEADAENKKHRDPDGFKIRSALLKDNIKDAVQVLIDLQLPANVLIFNAKECWLMESMFTDKDFKDYIYEIKKIKKDDIVVRTNHGIYLASGYDKSKPEEFESWESSQARYDAAVKGVKKAKDASEMLDAISDTSNANFMLNPLRRTPSHGLHILKTTGQLMLVPKENTLHYRPLWCDMDFSSFAKVNNEKTKTYYEIISSRKLVTVKENIINNNKIHRSIKMEKKFSEIVEEIVKGEFVPEFDKVDKEISITKDKEYQLSEDYKSETISFLDELIKDPKAKEVKKFLKGLKDFLKENGYLSDDQQTALNNIKANVAGHTD